MVSVSECLINYVCITTSLRICMAMHTYMPLESSSSESGSRCDDEECHTVSLNRENLNPERILFPESDSEDSDWIVSDCEDTNCTDSINMDGDGYQDENHGHVTRVCAKYMPSGAYFFLVITNYYMQYTQGFFEHEV